LERVINTRVLLLRDEAGRHFLRLYDGYLVATNLQSPWTIAAHAPEGAAEAELQAQASGQLDLMNSTVNPATGRPPSLHDAPPPAVHVATTPTELLTFDGQPSYYPIAGTRLLYAVNTSGNVFKLLTDQQTYVLISGRWFRAPSLDGPWQYVPGRELPRDFAAIPDDSPKENVKASVPGTTQAAEALIANSIPQSTEVPRSRTLESPHIDGPPQLRPIEGTPLYYVANSGTPIVKVDDHSWYACQDGVWFVATSVAGPWVPAASVPAVIYSIPTTSPLHYLTYVTVYGSTPDAVYEGYTPGYLGTEVADGGTVVYGTGYSYSPWIGAVWYGPPVTWGFGWDYCWEPWCGWYYGFGFGWDYFGPGYGWWRCHPPRPWWGPFRRFPGDDPHEHVAVRGPAGSLGTSQNLYARRGEPGGQGRSARDWHGDYGRSYNSHTGELAGGQSGHIRTLAGLDRWSQSRARDGGLSGRETTFSRGGAGGRQGLFGGLGGRLGGGHGEAGHGGGSGSGSGGGHGGGGSGGGGGGGGGGRGR
jgi:hypothetical protein